MMPHLDAESRLTLRRFATKLCVSSIIGLYSRAHYFPMVSLVLSLYSICSVVGAAAGQTAALVEAANRAPIVCEADVAGACGTCGRALTGP